MRIVFLLRHALYLRNFESALRALAERSHKIVLVMSPLDKQVDSTLLDALTRDYPGIRQQPIAPRKDWWWPASDGFRTLRDYLRYLEPEYRDSPALVARGRRRLPRTAIWIFDNVRGIKSKPVRRLLDGLARLIDRAIPPDPELVKILRRWSPDLLIVSPMIDFTYGQTDYVKAARYLGIPTILAVASWDNLTNKGLIQICPDRVLVWNKAQEREAVTMHGIPAERVKTTGAQLYDHWFKMKPSLDRGEFCTRAGGLDPGKPIILYLCSSSFICRDEVTFVKEWLRALRATDGELAHANVIVRPHPAHWEQWNGIDLSSLSAVVWPRGGAVPVDDESKRVYFDSLFHASAVVGVNTSGFIEAGILGRRTLAIKSGHFDETQEGTLHFRYLTQGGLVSFSSGFGEHFAELADAIRHQEEKRTEIQKFVADFVRPAGLKTPATPLFVDAVEEPILPQPWRVPAWAPVLRAAIWPVAAVLRRLVMSGTSGGVAYGGFERTSFPRLLKPRGVSTPNSELRVRGYSQLTEEALAKIAKSDKPIIVGPWLSEVGYELLYWIPMVRWAREAYALDRERFIVVSRGGVNQWYGDLARRYVELFDYYSPADFVVFNAERQKASGMQKQKGIADIELKFINRIEKELGLGDCDLLHPRLMYSGVFRYHWSQRSAMDHLLLHARYEPLALPELSEIEARLPDDYYAVRFYSRESFEDTEDNRDFVRQMIERMLERRDVVLMDSPFAVDDHTNVEWMKAAGNGNRYNNRLIRADGWMTPPNNLDVQSRIIARSHCFVGTYGGLSYLAGFYGKPSIAFHNRLQDIMDSHFNTAMTLFRALGAPLILLTPREAALVSELL